MPGGYWVPGGYGAPGGYGGYGTPGSGPYGGAPYPGGPYPGGPQGSPYGGAPYGGPYPGGSYGRPQAPRPGIVPLRPLNLSEILDGAFSAIRWAPQTILTSSAVVATICAVLNALLAYSLGRWLADVRTSGAESSTALSLAVGTLSFSGVTTVVTFIAHAVLTGILTFTVGQGVLGRKESLSSAWSAAGPRIWRLIGMLLLETLIFVAGFAVIIGLAILIGLAAGVGVGVLVGVLFSLAGGVYALIAVNRWQLAVPVVMLERSGPVKSLGRSWQLVRGSSWRVFGIALLTYLIVSIATEVINLPFAIGSGGLSLLNPHAAVHVDGLVLTAVGQIIAGTLITPLSSGVTVLLYTDLRMRREGMDIALQAAAAGPAAGNPMAGAPMPGTPMPGSPMTGDGPGASPW